MNKFFKVLIVVVCIIISLSAITYAATKIIKNIRKKDNITFNPSYESKLDENINNNIWVGTFELAWKELANKVGKDGKVELVEDVQIADELNKSTFSKDMISKDAYSLSVSKNESGGYDIYADLTKNLNFLHSFDNFSSENKKYTFGDSDESIKYFGIKGGTSKETYENVEVLFYNKDNTPTKSDNYAVILKTKEGDEIILYKTNEERTFAEYYEDIKAKAKEFTEDKMFSSTDELFIPFINLDGYITYDELHGKYIKNTNMYIKSTAQNVKFNLNEKGCNLQSDATLITGVYSSKLRRFNFNNTFILFMKEKNCDMPYFALKVDNTDILEKNDK